MDDVAVRIAQKLSLVTAQIKTLGAEKLCLEAELAELVGSKEEGAKTAGCGDYRVTTINRFHRGLVKEATMDDVIAVLGPDAAAPLFKTRSELVISAYRKLSDEQRYALAHLIVSTPAKMTVRVEPLSKD
jgi:hypothetical protein